MRDCVDFSGLDFYRFSFIGYNKDKYTEMIYNRVGGNFDKICKNIKEIQKVCKRKW